MAQDCCVGALSIFRIDGWPLVKPHSSNFRYSSLESWFWDQNQRRARSFNVSVEKVKILKFWERSSSNFRYSTLDVFVLSRQKAVHGAWVVSTIPQWRLASRETVSSNFVTINWIFWFWEGERPYMGSFNHSAPTVGRPGNGLVSCRLQYCCGYLGLKTEIGREWAVSNDSAPTVEL